VHQRHFVDAGGSHGHQTSHPRTNAKEKGHDDDIDDDDDDDHRDNDVILHAQNDEIQDDEQVHTGNDFFRRL